MALLTEYHPQFFTATILEWKPLLVQNKYKDIIVDSLSFLTQQNRLKVFCFVIMPNHFHAIWQIQPPHKREDVQRDFLKFTAQQIKFDLLKTNQDQRKQFEVNAKDRRYQFWERNPLSTDLYSHKSFMLKLEYVHNNPVQEKWKLASVAEEYKYSSAKFYETGTDDWGFLTHYSE